MTGSRHVVLLIAILQGVGDIEFAAEKLDVERGVPGWKIGIGKVTGQIRCARVPFEHVDAAGTEVGGVKVAVSGDRGFRGSLVNIRRGSDLQYFRCGSQSGTPARNRTVFAHEEEGIIIEGAGVAVEDLTGRGAGEGGGIVTTSAAMLVAFVLEFTL
jgi:hypothetical protein